jgi:hypothetical protein
MGKESIMRYTLRFYRNPQPVTDDRGVTRLGRIQFAVIGVIQALSGWVTSRNGIIIADTRHSYKSQKTDQKGNAIWYANVNLAHDVWEDLQNSVRSFWHTTVTIVTLEKMADGTLRVVPLEELNKERAAQANSQATRINGAAELIAHAAPQPTAPAQPPEDEEQQVAEDDLPFKV